MRIATRHYPQDTSMFLPGFEPDDYVSAQAPAVIEIENPVSTISQTADVAAHEIEVISTEAVQAASDQPVYFNFGDEPKPAKRTWTAFALDGLMPPQSDLDRVAHNISVLKLSRSLVQEGREPTADEAHQILRYTGWGSIARIFEDGLGGKALDAQQKVLRELLTQDEWASARASTPTAHYTDTSMVSAIWAAIERMGFKGGNIVEPAAGTGLFLAGMPAPIAQGSNITAVEIDKVSGGLLKQVFAPRGVNVQVEGLEATKLPGGFFDLCVGNVPFANVKVADLSKAAYANWSIHNWFFGKALDLVRPGGLVVFITSAYTMDGNIKVRKWLNVHAQLLDAVRLPKGAFQRQSKTEAVADILILRKRKVPDFTASDAWAQELKEAPQEMLVPGQSRVEYRGGRSHERRFLINPWYADHPSRVLGKLRMETDQYSKDRLNPIFEGTPDELACKLQEVMGTVLENAYEPRAARIKETALETVTKVTPDRETKAGQFLLHGDRLCISEGDQWLDVDAHYQGKVRQRILGLIGIRDAARDVLREQSESDDDASLAQLQELLNRRYDDFVAKHGYVHDKMNVRAFRFDPDFPLLLSLEDYDAEAGIATKADLFSMRTVRRCVLPTHAESIEDALKITLARHGRVELAELAQLLRQPIEKIVQSLAEGKLAFKDPITLEWQSADEYLSGHIREKIAVATASGEGFELNVKALTEVLPVPLGPGEIEARLGAPWVPTTVIRDFAAELLNAAKDKLDLLKITYTSEGSVWSVKADWGFAAWEKINTEWGTPERDFFTLLEAALNQQPPTITHKVDGKQVVDKKRTLGAREKYEQIRDEFRSWVFKDEARTALLVQLYNEKFNQIVLRKWNGDHLKIPGLSSVYELYPTQRNAIWRTTIGGNTLLAHDVGAGKSLIMQAGSMERRRLGLSAKPLHVIPNHMLLQYTGEFAKAFPGAKLLMVDKDWLHGDKRREFVARVAGGDWDAVVMTHSTFEMLPLKPEAIKAVVDHMLDQVRLALSMASDSGSKRSVKELEKRLKQLEVRLEKMIQGPRKDDFLNFEDLGVDMVFYDEAHLAKNLMRISKLPRVAGLPNTSSYRAFDLLIKSNAISGMLGGKEQGLVLATATPIANSIAEMHVFQRLLQPRTLEAMGLAEFDAWAATFGESVTGLELAPDGSGYRMNTRFARFVNVGELMSIFRMVADIQTAKMLKLPTPRIKGGKATVVQCASSEALKKFTQELVERAERVRSGSVKPSEDNMLKITHYGRYAATDMRLINPSIQPAPGGKLQMVVENVLRIYQERAEHRGTQVLFSDIGTPKPGKFTVYDQIREDLVKAGIPREEIEFIQNAKSDREKDRLFKLVNDGVVRVLLGSTTKMGVGTNIQQRLAAVHQIDVPWRPCDIRQRDGRGERVGNMWLEIELLRYCTVGSFDAYGWQTVEVKQNFIDQIMSGDTSVRTVEDISMTALSFAEIKAIASGNPIVLEKAKIDADVLKLTTLRDIWEQQRWESRNLIAGARKTLQLCDGWLAGAGTVEECARQVASGSKVFAPVPGLVAKAAEKFADQVNRLGAALQMASALTQKAGLIEVGQIGGFEIAISRAWGGAEAILRFPHVNKHMTISVRVKEREAAARAVLEAIASTVHFGDGVRQLQQEMTARIENCELLANSQFEHAERLQQLRLRQMQINTELDLDKDTAGTQTMEANEASNEATTDPEMEMAVA